MPRSTTYWSAACTTSISANGCARGKWVRGAINMIAFLVGVAIIAAIVAVELPALFMAQSIVGDHNNKQARQILDELGLASSP